MCLRSGPRWTADWVCPGVSSPPPAWSGREDDSLPTLAVQLRPLERGEDEVDEAGREVLTVLVPVLARRVSRARLGESPGTGARVGAHS